MSSKSIKTEAVFTKTEISNDGNVNFLLDSSVSIAPEYFSEFPIGPNISENVLLIWNLVALSCIFYCPSVFNTYR